MGNTTSFVLRHRMSERAWQASLVVELVDPVSGALVHRGIALRAVLNPISLVESGRCPPLRASWAGQLTATALWSAWVVMSEQIGGSDWYTHHVAAVRASLWELS